MKRRVAWILVVVGWALPGLVLGGITAVLFPRAPRGGPWGYLLTQIVLWEIWALFTPAIVWMARRFPLERGQLARSVPAHISAAIVCALLYTGVYTLVAHSSAPTAMTNEPPESLAALYRGYLASRTSLAVVVYVTVAGVTTALEERRRRREQAARATMLERDLARAQLQALQMQLQPHFLFNTLHTIGILTREDPKVASRLIVRLADLLRDTLALADRAEIPLAHEIALLRRYLEIEEARFGDRLSVTIDIPSALEHLMVPSLVLQPLVENAVRHGVAPRAEPGRIALRAAQDGGDLVLTVEDDGPGFQPGAASPAEGAGVGLSVTAERIAVRYRGRASLRSENVAGGGARVSLRIPVSG